MKVETLEDQASSEQTAFTDHEDVPIVDTKMVQELMVKLDAERKARETLEKRLNKVSAIPHGVARPEAADDYVESDDTTSFPQLNQLNSNEVIQNATRAGKFSYQRSRVTHRNAVPHDPRGGQATTVWMYDRGGWARRVRMQSLDSAIASGLYPTCPLCDGWHRESETNPNVCPNREKVAYTICQICRANGSIRYIWDIQDKAPLDEYGNEIGAQLPDDPFYVQAGEIKGDAKERIRVTLEKHIRAYHPNTAASMKLNAANEVTL